MRSIPTVTKNLLIINVLAYLVGLVLEGQGVDLSKELGLHFFMSSQFHIWQFVTYMFLHGGFQHLFFNMFALWMFGCVVERTWGAKKFLFYYISCGVGAGIIQELAQFARYYADGLASYEMVQIGFQQIPMDTYLGLWTTVGASGAIYALLLAFGMLFPEERIFIFPLPIPIKGKWFVCIYAAIELFAAMTSSGDNIAHMAHLGGMLFGYFMIKYWERKPFYEEIKEDNGESIFTRAKKKWNEHKKSNIHVSSRNDSIDWQYNERKKKNQDEIDRILDKIRKSGYDSLNAKEKKTLFDASNK